MSLSSRIRSDGGGGATMRRLALRGRPQHDRRRRIRIAEDALILQANHPAEFLFPGDDRNGGSPTRSGGSRGAGRDQRDARGDRRQANAACRCRSPCASARDDSMQPRGERPAPRSCRFSTSRLKDQSAWARRSLAERLATRLDATDDARGDGESVSRGLLRRAARRGAAGAAVLPAQPAPAADRRCGRETCSRRRRSATTCSTRTRSSRI